MVSFATMGQVSCAIMPAPHVSDVTYVLAFYARNYTPFNKLFN